MRYQNFKAFEKHLQSASPSHFSSCYLLLLDDEAEKQRALKLLERALSGSFTRFSGSHVELKDFFDAVQSPSLFGEEAIVLLEESEKLGKPQVETLGSFLEKGAFSGRIVLSAKGKTPLLKTVEKIGVVFDMSGEKPWDKEKRLVEHLVQMAQSAQKQIAPNVALLLIERVGSDTSLLEREMEKLICFAFERPTIERDDVLQIATTLQTHTVWHMAEEIVWNGAYFAEAHNFHALLPAIRSQLELGLKISDLLGRPLSSEEWSAQFPKMWPRTLDKRKDGAAKKGTRYFKKGLEQLFKIELASRTESTHLQALLDQLFSTLKLYAR